MVEGAVCVCLRDYKTVDHLIWRCKRFGTENGRLTDALNVQFGTLVWDLCALKRWRAVFELEFDDLAVLLQKLTSTKHTKYAYFWNQRAICHQKSTMLLFRPTSNFDCTMNELSRVYKFLEK
jgi:hypothetical protein